MACSAEEKISIPIDAPTNPLIRTMKIQALTLESSSQLRCATPNGARNALRKPVSQASHFHSSTYSTGGEIRGSSHRPRKNAGGLFRHVEGGDRQHHREADVEQRESAGDVDNGVEQAQAGARDRHHAAEILRRSRSSRCRWRRPLPSVPRPSASYRSRRGRRTAPPGCRNARSATERLNCSEICLTSAVEGRSSTSLIARSASRRVANVSPRCRWRRSASMLASMSGLAERRQAWPRR